MTRKLAAVWVGRPHGAGGGARGEPGSAGRAFEHNEQPIVEGIHFGPAIDSFGTVVPVDSHLTIPTDHHYTVVFELMRPSDSPEVANDWIESVARFINVQVAPGAPYRKAQWKHPCPTFRIVGQYKFHEHASRVPGAALAPSGALARRIPDFRSC